MHSLYSLSSSCLWNTNSPIHPAPTDILLRSFTHYSSLQGGFPPCNSLAPYCCTAHAHTNHHEMKKYTILGSLICYTYTSFDLVFHSPLLPVQSLHLHLFLLCFWSDRPSPLVPLQAWQAERSQFRAVTSSHPPLCLHSIHLFWKNINTSFLLHQSDEGSSWGQITLLLRGILCACVSLSINQSFKLCLLLLPWKTCMHTYVCILSFFYDLEPEKNNLE